MRRWLSRLTFRQWTALLAIACVLPAVLATSILLFLSYQRQRAEAENAAIGVARALMQAVDRELAGAQGALLALSTSPYLAGAELENFYRQAKAVIGQHYGDSLILSDSTGRQVFNTLVPRGSSLPMHGNAAQIRQVFASGKPAVSDLYNGPLAQRYLVSVDMPFYTAPGEGFVLSLQFFPEELGKILSRQRIPPDWVVAILDSKGIVVARTREPARFIGQPATPGLWQSVQRAMEGAIEDQTLEGIPSVAAFSRSAISNWTVVIGMHRDSLTAPLRTNLLWLAGGAVLLFVLGLLLARLIGEHLAQSIRGLVPAALSLGHDRPVELPPLNMREAQAVGQALEQAATLLRQRTEERDRAERTEHALRIAKQEIERSEAFLRGIFDETPDAVFLIGADGKIVRSNPQAAYLLGCAERQLVGVKIDEVLFDARADRPRSLFAALSAVPRRCAILGDESRLQARRADGSVFPVELTASPFARSAREHFIIVTVRDITARERNEQALRESEKRFRSTLEHAPIGMAIVSLEGRWMEVNRALCDLLGYERDALMQLRFQDVTHPDDLAEDLGYAQSLLEGKIRSYQLEKRYIREDGSIVSAWLTGSLVRDDDGRPLHYIAQIQDISERKRAEQQLATLTKRLALATQAGGIAVWEWNIATGELVWDERMYELYRVSPDEERGTYAMWSRRVHPDDLAKAELARDEALAGIRDYDTEFRVVWPDGQIRLVRANAVISRDEHGIPLRMTGANIDITDSRKKEEAIAAALREKETLLKELYHRVKNNLQVVASLFNLQSRTLPEGAARTALAEGAGRVRAMALVHEKLYQSSSLSSIALDSYVADLCAQLSHAASAAERGIALDAQVERFAIDVETAVPLGLVLNELICNSLEHGFPDGRTGKIAVRIARRGGDAVGVEVRDNGVGLPDGMNYDQSTTLGLKLVAALSGQLGGKFSIQNDQGACATLVFPLQAGNRDEFPPQKEG